MDDGSWEKWLLDLEMDEHDMNPLEEEFINGNNSLQSELSWESHSYDSNFMTENTGFGNTTSVKQQHGSSEKPVLLSSMSHILSFEDSTTVPNKKTYQNRHDQQSREIPEELHNRKSKRGRNSSQIRDHIISERKRRENLTRMFIALSAIIPDLKKMDKSSIINNAINYVKHLQNRVKDLEEQTNKRKKESLVFIKKDKINGSIVDDFSCTSDDLHRPIEAFPNVEASISAKDVLIRVMCEKQKDIVMKLLAKLEAHDLSLVCSNVLPFGNSTLVITIIAQVDHEFNMTMDDLVKNLIEDLLECCNLQQ